jgi:Rrf2 family protein
MLTHTSELAIRALIQLGAEDSLEPTPPRQIAEALGCSPTYLRKTLGLLAKAGILRSRRGVHGGVVLAQAASDVTLLAIVEACQGLLPAAYCQELGPTALRSACAFHQAMDEVYTATKNALSHWTLADLLEHPGPTDAGYVTSCRMTSVGRARMVRRAN